MSEHPWWLKYDGDQPTIDDLPASRRRRFRDRHPVIVVACWMALIAAWPLAYELALGVIH
jgi:hypothetical protein